MRIESFSFALCVPTAVLCCFYEEKLPALNA
jgi:hypothetical protein